MSTIIRWTLAAAVVCGVLPAAFSHAVWAADSDAAAAPDIANLLKQGKLSEAEQQLNSFLKQNAGHDQAEYALGVVQLLSAAETLAQDLYRYGLRGSGPATGLRLPVPDNPKPEKLDHAGWVAVRQRLIDNLAKASDTLEQVQGDDIKLVLPMGEVRLDLNGDGQATEKETFWVLFRQLAGIRQELTEEQKAFEIAFDAADVDWMIGYTHVLRGLFETWLAYDSSEAFRYGGYLLFAGAEPPYPELGAANTNDPWNADFFADGLASIHLMSCPVDDAARLKRARQHFLSMIACSRKSWEHCLAETDNDREWVPNANQTSVVPMPVNQQQIDAWMKVLEQGEAVLNGEMLIPHWRVKPGQGINMKRVFEEPREFDLILWIHGAAAVPYLEQGPVMNQEDSNRLLAAFQGRFFSFALWFN